ncbi:STY4534 family ICE replication protein [Alcanivorax sp. ZXX171]|uniref:STY4534 family ICE replication protein n=1 Tax=Alloalcanivorax xenomutans TaxID=1094342 RepID=UPI000C61FEC5|nr:hypothetical protein [Alcanivorax sp.]MAY11028.1 hypothetical protein [Alcanivorax sp.]MBI54107.1 hypothetical protein [Alcanivorax sp.]MBM1145095.1 DUF3577 domain-containing protein [Alcanivorax sp. ZXX171]|tara:strand:- start:418 stop:1185 length:768 start_codon:yes stop_codon:yes gene_type:complete
MNPAQSTQPTQSTQEKQYFDLHTTGIGYLNRIREVSPKKGQPFLACNIAALSGAADDVVYTRFDCRVSGKEAEALVRQYEDAVKQDQKVLISFRIGDLWADTFTYTKGDKVGQTGVSLKARLLFISWIKVNGQLVYKAERPQLEQDPSGQADQSGQDDQSEAASSEDSPAPAAEASPSPEEAPRQSAQTALPETVQLSKDATDFQERKAALKQQGYRFDGQAKVWRLPTDAAKAAIEAQRQANAQDWARSAQATA